MNDAPEQTDAGSENVPVGASAPDAIAAVTASAAPRAGRWAAAKWAFALVPAIGLVELALHFVQTRSAPSDADWTRLRGELTALSQPGDLIVVAPDWVDPLARQKLGRELLSIEREARPDASRFPRAIEVSVRGKHANDLAGWAAVERRKVGPFELTTLANPAPVTLKDDLVRHMASGKMRVFYTDGGAGASACARQHGSSQTGNIGFGPGVAADRFVCAGGGFVALTILPDLDYVPHQCFFAPPPGGNAAVRVVFDEVKFGRALHGHHAISVHAERDRTGTPVTIVFKVGERVLGRYVHRDGDGWKGFEADTADLDGQTGELTVEISSANPSARQYCFEADTR